MVCKGRRFRFGEGFKWLGGKTQQALARGYDGLRLTGNTFWLEKEDWNDFVDYEEQVNNVIGNYQMIALCTYSLDKCSASEIIDVTINHQFALIKQEGKWQLIESLEHKRMEETIIQANKDWEQTFDSVPDLINIVDLKYKIVRLNRAMAERLGVTPEDCIGLTCYNVIHGADEPPVYCPHQKLLKDSLEHTAEIHEDTLAGDFIISASPMYDSEGKLMGSVHVARDITNRKQAEEKLEKTLEDLKRSNKDLQRFAYVASHDLKEPLRMIISFLQLLEKRYKDKLDEDANEFIGFAVDGATRLDEMISDLLVYSRITSKEKEFEHVNCEKILKETVDNLQLSIEEAGAEITHDPLPIVYGDCPQMVQLFQNLIGNAIKYRSEEKPKIHISSYNEGGEWIFSVKDNGIGISPEHLERIFTIFQRLHSREEYDGTGIGLAIAAKIVELHGGKIWAESEPGRGSTFYFTISS